MTRVPRRLIWIGAALLAVLVLVQIVRQLPSSQPAATPTPLSQGRYIAHGIVTPVSQARVGTLSGGVLSRQSVEIGARVEAQQEIAQVRGPGGLEQLTAPFDGTVTGVLAHTGDTLVPGAGVMTIADLTRLQVETTDVDEFLIGHVRPGQTPALQIEALDRRELTGRVRTVALQPQSTTAGDQHYPVTIDLGGQQPDLRPGMSVRITFSE
jgi:multidrug resistance efflux pump